MAVTRIPIPAWAKTEKADDRLELSLSEIGLIVRTVNILEEEGIFTVRDLLDCTPERLLRISNLGEKTLGTIYEALAKIGFQADRKTERTVGTGLCPSTGVRSMAFRGSPGSGTMPSRFPAWRE
jgi:DNA-directed RNA polymerase subunit alpha